ncbi:hypothetical protein [Halobaculum rarum]|uniref:DUF7845 domain-containing protein n=1 Tax=Halobaculum rarum TaxID=3075122 RepID=UPI0032AE88B9
MKMERCGLRPCVLVPQTHELQVYLNYDTGSLDLYHAVVERAQGIAPEDVLASFDRDGRTYEVSLQPKSSGLDAPNDEHGFMLDTSEVLEPIVTVNHRETDTNPLRFYLKPRWPGQTANGEPIAFDPDYVGVGVFAQGSNHDPDAYPELLRAALRALGLHPGNLRDPLPSSSILRLARYVRGRRERTKQLVRGGGVFDRIAETVETADGTLRDDRGVPGNQHIIPITADGAASLIEGHSHAKTLKHYYPKFQRSDATAEADEDPLAHPKIEVYFSKTQNQSGTVPWGDRDRLVREIDELLTNTLVWGGLTPTGDERYYVADDYFRVEDAPRDLTLANDPTEALADDQQSWVEAMLYGEARPTDAEMDVLDAVADGGSASVSTVADRADVSKRTVYRAARDNPEVLSVRDSVVDFATEVVRGAVGGLRERVGRILDAVRGDDDDTDEQPDSDDEAQSAWQMWLAKYVSSFDDRHPKLKIDLGELSEDADPDEILREGYHKWRAAGNEPRRFKIAKVKYTLPDETLVTHQGLTLR